MLRRVAFTAALAALLVPAGQAEAKKTPKKPVVTSVRPMEAKIGDTITIHGKHFVKGKAKNTIAFRRDGAKTVFAKADVSTLTQIRVVLPDTLAPFLKDGSFTQFRIRVLSRRFGKSFTPASKSPRIGPAPVKPGTVDPAAPGAGATPASPAATPAVPAPAVDTSDCDADGVLNKNEDDDDDDLLSDTLEKELMTDGCSADSDADGVRDGYEYKSAIDLNDDEYQQPNTALPFPGKRPYPNPLYADAEGDFDHDGLPQVTEFELWKLTHTGAGKPKATLFPLSYSDGLQYSVHGVCKAADNPAGSPCGANDAGRRYPTLQVANYDRWFGAGGFYRWLQANNYETVRIGWNPADMEPGVEYHILDVNHTGTVSDGGYTTSIDGVALNFPDSEGNQFPGNELYPFSDGSRFLSDEERDEDADGLSNITELRGRMARGYWASCYSTETPFPADPGQDDRPLSPFVADSDGDGVRDGADDEDHDDIPNIMELSRMKASGYDDTEDGSTPPVVPEGAPAPTPTVGGGPLCKLDKELPPKGEEGQPKPMWNGPAKSWARVNPFNPCLPDARSRSCSRGTSFKEVPAPLDESPMHHQWFSLQ